jgi:hypothetical protein
MKKVKLFESFITEANRGKVHKAAKKGSYPASIVVINSGMVVKQELVNTPAEVPAVFNELQKQYPNATISVESSTGETLFSESVVNEGKGAKNYFEDLKYNYTKSLRHLDSDEKKEYNKLAKDFFSKLAESVVTESVFSFKTDNVEQLHFEMDPKTAELMKIELGKSQGEVTKRKQIESGEYSLRRFRKSINYGNGKDVGVFLPGSYDASVSKLGDGPHKKAVKAIKWNQKKYDQWLEDMAANGGAENAFDMAQNAKNETGLIDWVKKNFRGDDPMQRIQWDIEAFA